MTPEEKKMKQYTRSIERRLNMPRAIKARVMSDFISSITARREAGMTDAEIYTELGNPQKAAEELNKQMKEYTYRKSPWRYVFAVCAAYGGAKLLGRLLPILISLGVRVWDHFSADTMAVSVGIIGGADGPTAIFVTAPPWAYYLLPAVLLTIGIWGYIRLSRCRKK